MATVIDQDVPRSVQNLWHAAQVSHQGIAPATDILEAVCTGGGTGKARHSLALGIQESTSWELIDLMVDKVLSGKGLHELLKSLNDEGFIRRNDLVEWSEVFTSAAFSKTDASCPRNLAEAAQQVDGCNRALA